MSSSSSASTQSPQQRAAAGHASPSFAVDDPVQLSRGVSSMDGETVQTMLMEPYVYLCGIKGKGVRNTLIEAFQEWLRVPFEKMSAVGAIVEKLHNASLLIDDIEDASEMRRGQPVAHAIYGVPLTLNCGNYVYFQAMNECRRLDSSAALDHFLDEMLALHRGQGLDIYWRDRGECPTEQDYRSMVLDKTGGLFRLAVKLMQCFSDVPGDGFVRLADRLGLFFQIRDDYVNLKDLEYMAGKLFCEDITEGKFSFPIIHCIRSRPEDHRMLSILKQRTTNDDLKRHAVIWMQECGSFSYTRGVLCALAAEIRVDIDRLGGNSLLAAMIDKLCAGVCDSDRPEDDAVDKPH